MGSLPPSKFAIVISFLTQKAPENSKLKDSGALALIYFYMVG